MEVQAFQYIQDQGWSITEFPNMDSDNTLIFVFGSPDFKNNPKPIKELSSTYKKSKIIGCSTSGEIFNDQIFDNSLSIAIVKFENTTLKLVDSDISNTNESFSVGSTIGQALESPELQGIFILCDGLNINGSELVKGMNKTTHDGVVITGGLAGDGSAFKQTWIICQDKLLTHHVTAVGLYGEHIRIGHGSKGGWDIFGPERLITYSSGNILYEFDNQPALKLYKEYLGERAKELPASGLLFPLSIRDPSSDSSEKLVRTILNVDEASQSLIFAGEVPTGHYAQLMRANFDRLITSASEAGELSRNLILNKIGEPVSPLLAISISCVGRRLLLGARTEEEVESTLATFPPGSTQIGFYSYGELSPVSAGNCELHNQTMTITTYVELPGNSVARDDKPAI